MRVDVEGPAATDAEIDPARGDHRLGDGDDFALGKRCGVGPDPRAKSLTLRDIEHGAAFEKRHRARRSTVARRPLGFALRNELAGIDHGRAALTLADIAAGLPCLTERQPAFTLLRVEQGKSGPDSLVLGGRGINKKKNID